MCVRTSSNVGNETCTAIPNDLGHVIDRNVLEDGSEVRILFVNHDFHDDLSMAMAVRTMLLHDRLDLLTGEDLELLELNRERAHHSALQSMVAAMMDQLTGDGVRLGVRQVELSLDVVNAGRGEGFAVELHFGMIQSAQQVVLERRGMLSEDG